MIQQILYGYSSGHRRIVGSLPSDPIVERSLALLSDPVMLAADSGVNGQLTGYYIRERDVYALLRTWWATSSHRPGAVWTHVLLLEKDILDAPINPLALVRLLTPPDGNVERYSQALPSLDVRVGADVWALDVPDASARGVVGSLLRQLYRPRGRASLVIDMPLDYITVTLGIWAQQWPDLRRDFTMAVGGVPRRTLPSAPDLAILSPPAAARGHIDQATMVRRGDSISLDGRGDWARVAASDLIDSANPTLRAFMRIYGPEQGRDRAAFAHLVDVYTAVSRVSSDSQVIGNASHVADLLCGHFPGRRRAPTLKSDLLGSDAIPSPFRPFDTESSKLLALVGHARCFDPDALRVAFRSEGLARRSPSEGWSLASKAHHRSRETMTTNILMGVAIGIPASDLCAFASQDWETTLELVRIEPRLATARCLWNQMNVPVQRLVGAVTPAMDGPVDLARAVVAALCEGGSLSAVTQFQRSSLKASRMIVKWIDDRPRTAHTVEVAHAVVSAGPKAFAALAGLEPLRPATLRQLLSGLRMGVEAIQSGLTAKTWIPLADAEAEGSENDPEVAVRLYVVALHATGGAGRELLAKSFIALHKILAASSLTLKTWDELDPWLPPPPMWRDWDACDRLRRGFVAAFAGATGDVSWFEAAALSVDRYAEMEHALSRQPGGRDIASQLRRG